MATPATLTMAEPSLTQVPSNISLCPACGFDLASASASASASSCFSQYPTEAQQRIQELEAQVKLLNSKASDAADKLADYEDEVQSLRAQVQKASLPQSAPAEEETRPKTAGAAATAAAAAPALTRLGSLSSLLGRRKLSDNTNTTTTNNNNNNNNNNQQTPAAPSTTTSLTTGLGIGFLLNQSQSTAAAQPSPASAPPSGNVISPTSVSAPGTGPGPGLASATDPTLQSLQAQLENEKSLRTQAEANLHASQLEIEELTTQLFGEANEMVAQERQERARLEDRLKILEERDQRRGETLDRLEARIKRVDRVRGMVGR